jgi:hypothetical protein
MLTMIDDTKLKQLLKEALIETLEEKRIVFQDLIFEAMEDVALIRAIQGGETSGKATKKEIYNILEGRS